MDGLKPYLEWQSGMFPRNSPVSQTDEITDSAFKKNPPADYFYPALDIFGKLASIRTNLVNKLYSNEFSFQKDLYQVFAPGHDGHYIVYPDLLSKAFQFGRPLRVVSISKDGTSIPEIYIYGKSIHLIPLPRKQNQLLMPFFRGHHQCTHNCLGSEAHQWY